MGPRRPHSRAPSPYETAQRFTDPKAAQARTAGTETTTKPRAMSPTQKANEVVCEKLYQQGGRPAAAVAVAVPAALSRTRKTARKASSTRARKPPRGVPAVRVDAAAPLVQPYRLALTAARRLRLATEEAEWGGTRSVLPPARGARAGTTGEDDGAEAGGGGDDEDLGSPAKPAAPYRPPPTPEIDLDKLQQQQQQQPAAAARRGRATPTAPLVRNPHTKRGARWSDYSATHGTMRHAMVMENMERLCDPLFGQEGGPMRRPVTAEGE